jgi:type II secretory pathway component PulK
VVVGVMRVDDMKKGSILIVVLWALFFLGALAVSIGTRVAASIRLAEHLKAASMVNHVASAGVARAVAVIRSGNEEILTGPGSEYWSRDNPAVEGGVFSVVFLDMNGDQQSVTNYGVTCESSRTNINNMAQIRGLLQNNADSVSAESLVANVRKYRLAKKTLTKGRSNGRFESVYEVLLVDGMTDELFEEIEPSITVFNSDCFSGISKARIFSGSGDDDASVIAEGQIEFVFNRKKGKIVYWKQ